MSAHGSLKAVYFALGGNLLIAFLKFIVSIITGSSAMLAESVHSTATPSTGVAAHSNKRSRKVAMKSQHGISREIFSGR
jgi:divalent metal cation (Fe/Co/Zn/Cd) transporter